MPPNTANQKTMQLYMIRNNTKHNDFIGRYPNRINPEKSKRTHCHLRCDLPLERGLSLRLRDPKQKSLIAMLRNVI